MTRILYILPGPSPLSEDTQRNNFFHLSKYFDGDVLATMWGVKSPESIRRIDEINLAMGNFRYHVTYSSRLPILIKVFWNVLFFVSRGFYFHYFKKKYDVIVAYGPFTTGIAGLLLKKLTGVKLIIEMPGNPKKAFFFDAKKISITHRIKRRLADLIVPFVINSADHLKLLYPNQLSGYKNIDDKHASVFHTLVPISSLTPVDRYDEYILFLGYPWFLKGVDVLIRAFKLISQEFPNYILKVVGFCPERAFFQELAEGNEKIELCNPVFPKEAMDLLSKCALFILPSRTEAMGRVLLEAMAFKKPIIASNVDGIPFYIQHGFNGLLFKSENADDLAEKITMVLKDREYASVLGQNGYEYAHRNLSETSYIDSFKKMVEQILSQH